MALTSGLGKLHNWYARFERPISSLSLISGFAINIFALTRVDLFWENFWIAIHLLIVATATVLINRQENLPVKGMAKNPTEASKLHFWLLSALQFAFGGLFGTYLVFYFRSATLSAMWPFLLIITIILVANERLKWHYARLGFQIGFFYLSVFLFTTFLIPVIVHQIGPGVFLISGGASLLLLGLFLLVLRYFAREKFNKGRGLIFGVAGGIFILMNVLYFAKLIPPLPLSLKDAGIYHSVLRTPSGDYSVDTEASTGGKLSAVRRYFDRYETLHIESGESAYAYTAIFSPISFNLGIVHEWERYDSVSKKWIPQAKIPLSVSGGRENGFRTYSQKTAITEGKWRVNIRTRTGEEIGRLLFYVEFTTTPRELISEIK